MVTRCLQGGVWRQQPAPLRSHAGSRLLSVGCCTHPHPAAGITEKQLARYSQEQHEDFWLKGADDPRYKEQLRQQEAAKKAAGGGAQQVAAGTAEQQGNGQQQQAQQQAAQQQQQQVRDIPDPAGAAAQRQAVGGNEQAGARAVQR